MSADVGNILAAAETDMEEDKYAIETSIEESNPAALTVVEEDKPAAPQTVIDEGGDLVLRVGEELASQAIQFLVCSSTMRRSSPVFKAMLFGGFQESKPQDGDWVVSLPEDDPEALETLLNIVHGNFSETPRELDLAGIYKVVVLMDKYDTLRFTRPWKDDWLGKVKAESKSSSGPLLCMGLYVALQIGADPTAFIIASHMSKFAIIDKEDKITVFGSEIYESVDTVGPHNVSEMIRNMQQARIRHVVDGIWRAIDEAMNIGNRSDQYEDYDFLGRLWVAQTKARGHVLPRWPVVIQESPSALVSSFEWVVALMNLPRKGLASINSNVENLKSALRHAGDDKMCRFWSVDFEFMRTRRELTGIVQIRQDIGRYGTSMCRLNS